MTEIPPSSRMSRRTLLTGAAVTSALSVLPSELFAQQAAAGSVSQATSRPAGKLKLSLFSKIMQWTDLNEAVAIAKDLGFDALDLTVRNKGHVLPERVEVDLPRAVETVRKAGLEVSMITTDIKSVSSPYAEVMLKTASQQGIHHYRWGGLLYKGGRGISDQLNDLKPQVKALAELNRRYEMCGIYHTHSGPDQIGGPIWDLWLLLQGLDPRWIAMNYDIGHATVEGGYGGWETSAQLARDSMRGIALKDFRWPSKPVAQATAAKKSRFADVAPEWCPIGEGIVDFRGFFSIVKANNFAGPIQFHFEYPAFGGAENGETTLRIPKAQLIAAVRKDLDYIKAILRDLELV
jgi:sugar phosphate isomerase/epimerase